MLAKCVNPMCSTPFRYLESGRLFRLESDPLGPVRNRAAEYFWLCRNCSGEMTLRIADVGGVEVIPRHEASGRGEDAIPYVQLDRQHGMILNRINLVCSPARKRRERPIGGPIRV
jgi:hypothetical protein